MKKLLLGVFALAAMTASASLIELVPVRQHTPTNAPVQVANAQMAKKAVRLSTPLKAISIDRLIGARFQTSAPVEEGFLTCNPVTVAQGAANEIEFTNFLGIEGTTIKATVDLTNNKITLAPGQVTYSNGTYGECKMYTFTIDEEGNVTKDETANIEGTIDEETGDLYITTPFATFIMTGQYAGYYFGDMMFANSLIETPNATMTNTQNNSGTITENEDDVVVAQSDDFTEATVANFGCKGYVVSMNLKEDKSVEVPVQEVCDMGDYGIFSIAPITGYDDTYGDPIYGEGPIQGVGTDTQITFDGEWTMNSPVGYYMFINYNTVLNMKEGYMLRYPGQQEPSAVNDVNANKTVASTTYVNLAGQSSAAPFDGVNIVVTRYTDGTQNAAKIIK